MKLSQDRAQAVAGFLTGVLNTEPSRISWIGHGMTRPSASNATAAGRAKNRRVEIVLLTNE
jgi:outer membrane protein OmpA-like peptidoglycan-associated protein